MGFAIEPTFQNAGGRGRRTIGTKPTLVVAILGLPVSARADPAKPYDVMAGRELLRVGLDGLPRVEQRRWNACPVSAPCPRAFSPSCSVPPCGC
jgi:hypothetical protein